VIEVVLDVRRRLDEGEANAAAYVEHVWRPLRELGTRRREIGDAKRYVGERALLAGALRVEQGELAATGVTAHQRERVLARDHVHSEVVLEKLGDRIAICDPESDVIKGLGLHGARII
jgi:hypothetical protein